MKHKGLKKDNSRKTTGAVTPTNDNKLIISFADIINLAIAFLTAGALFVSALTIYEMRKDRDAAFLPAILMNPSEFEIVWDNNGSEEWLSSLPDESQIESEINEDGSITGSFSIPAYIFRNNGFESFSVVNLGVGAAEDIVFKWDSNNVPNLIDYLLSCDPSKSDFCTYGESVVFSFDDRIVIAEKEQVSRLMYMLPNASEIYSIPLPAAYTIIINEIIKNAKLPKDLPQIILYADYTDVQGKKQQSVFYILINRLLFEENVEGGGRAIYQLTPNVLKI